MKADKLPPRPSAEQVDAALSYVRLSACPSAASEQAMWKAPYGALAQGDKLIGANYTKTKARPDCAMVILSAELLHLRAELAALFAANGLAALEQDAQAEEGTQP